MKKYSSLKLIKRKTMTKNQNVKCTISIFLLSALFSYANAVPDQPKEWERCAGISKAGKNKCGAIDGSHKCGGMAKHDNLDVDWIYVPKGTCDRITGGKIIKVVAAKKK